MGQFSVILVKSIPGLVPTGMVFGDFIPVSTHKVHFYAKVTKLVL